LPPLLTKELPITALSLIKFKPNCPYTLSWNLTLQDSKDVAMEYQFSAFAAFRLYWDDQLIGSSGEVASAGHLEIPGPIENTFLLDKKLLTAGQHALRLEASSFYRQQGMPLIRHTRLLSFGDRRFISLGSLIPSLLLSACFIIGCYFLLLYATEPQTKAHLFFAISCLGLSLYGFANQWPFLIGIDYHHYPLSRTLLRIGCFAFAFSFALYYVSRFAKYWRYYSVFFLLQILLLTLLLPPSGSTIGSVILALVFGVVMLLSQWRHQYQGYWLELVVLAACTMVAAYNFADFENFFVAFPLFIIALLAIQAVNMQRQRTALQQSLLNASTLESSLLRKNIQPHFILNSLMSITQWIEEDPQKSIEFVESLADEFRLFAQLAGQKLVPLHQDIELARHHLNIMGFRLEKTFTLTVKGEIQHDWLPPGIIHTLVENGVSHNKYSGANIEFILERTITDKQVIFCLFTPLGKVSKRKNQPQMRIGNGTGSQYIHAQLEQAFGVHYQLVTEQNDRHWLTRISIPVDAYQLVIEGEA
jgi:sensor histidine kinase YesM